MEDFEGAMERVIAGMQQRRVVTEKEKRILAYHEAGHALIAYMMGDLLPIQKVTIVGRGDALGYAYYLPMEERYLHTKEEFLDVMKIAARRACSRAGRLRPRHQRRLERPREGDRDRPRDGLRVRHVRGLARRARCAPTTTPSPRRRSACATPSRPASPTTPTRRRSGCSIKHRVSLDRLAGQLLERETLSRDELKELLGTIEPESRASETVGTVRAVEKLDR
jgi:cell division protease FtsH